MHTHASPGPATPLVFTEAVKIISHPHWHCSPQRQTHAPWGSGDTPGAHMTTSFSIGTRLSTTIVPFTERAGANTGPHSDRSVFDLAARPAGSRTNARLITLAKGTRGLERAHHTSHTHTHAPHESALREDWILRRSVYRTNYGLTHRSTRSFEVHNTQRMSSARHLPSLKPKLVRQ